MIHSLDFYGQEIMILINITEMFINSMVKYYSFFFFFNFIFKINKYINKIK